MASTELSPRRTVFAELSTWLYLYWLTLKDVVSCVVYFLQTGRYKTPFPTRAPGDVTLEPFNITMVDVERDNPKNSDGYCSDLEAQTSTTSSWGSERNSSGPSSSSLDRNYVLLFKSSNCVLNAAMHSSEYPQTQAGDTVFDISREPTEVEEPSQTLTPNTSTASFAFSRSPSVASTPCTSIMASPFPSQMSASRCESPTPASSLISIVEDHKVDYLSPTTKPPKAAPAPVFNPQIGSLGLRRGFKGSPIDTPKHGLTRRPSLFALASAALTPRTPGTPSILVRSFSKDFNPNKQNNSAEPRSATYRSLSAQSLVKLVAPDLQARFDGENPFVKDGDKAFYALGFNPFLRENIVDGTNWNEFLNLDFYKSREKATPQAKAGSNLGEVVSEVIDAEGEGTGGNAWRLSTLPSATSIYDATLDDVAFQFGTAATLEHNFGPSPTQLSKKAVPWAIWDVDGLQRSPLTPTSILLTSPSTTSRLTKSLSQDSGKLLVTNALWEQDPVRTAFPFSLSVSGCSTVSRPDGNSSPRLRARSATMPEGNRAVESGRITAISRLVDRSAPPKLVSQNASGTEGNVLIRVNIE